MLRFWYTWSGIGRRAVLDHPSDFTFEIVIALHYPHVIPNFTLWKLSDVLILSPAIFTKKNRFLLTLPLFKACYLKPLIDDWLLGLKYLVFKMFERLRPVRNRHSETSVIVDKTAQIEWPLKISVAMPAISKICFSLLETIEEDTTLWGLF